MPVCTQAALDIHWQSKKATKKPKLAKIPLPQFHVTNSSGALAGSTCQLNGSHADRQSFNGNKLQGLAFSHTLAETSFASVSWR